MQEFILKNWKLIAAALLMIVSTIVSTIIIVKNGKGKISVWDALKSVILEKIPSFIAMVEVDGHGEEKKNKVIQMALKEASESLGRSLTDDESEAIIALVSKQIELTLATPQKKETKPSKGKYRV